MVYAVIDTNVLVSALITHNPQSATSRVVRHLLDGDFVPLYDGDIVAEYADVLHRKKFKLLPEVADSIISFIIENGVEADRTTFGELMPDEDDRVFYEVALSMDESFLVTGNQKHYPVSPKVVSPTDFVHIMER